MCQLRTTSDVPTKSFRLKFQTSGFIIPPTALEKPSAAWRGQRLQGLPEGGAEVSRALPYVSTLLHETEYRAANCRAPVQLAARNLRSAVSMYECEITLPL